MNASRLYVVASLLRETFAKEGLFSLSSILKTLKFVFEKKCKSAVDLPYAHIHQFTTQASASRGHPRDVGQVQVDI